MTEAYNVAASGAGDGYDPKQAANAIRSNILKTRQRRSRHVTFMGEVIEVRQPTIKGVVSSGSDQNEDQHYQLVRLAVQNAYVPGTDTLVFDEAHIPQILNLPYDESFNELASAVSEMISTDVVAAEKN